jgi:hypothetical protein
LAPLVPFYHLRDDVFPRQPQYSQNIGMACTRIIIKELDPRIVLSPDLPSGPQDDRLEYLPRFDHSQRP